MTAPAGRGATEVPVDAEAEAARVVPAGEVATAVNLVNPVIPANLAGSRRGSAKMTPEPTWNVEIPRVGREVGSQCGPASEGDQPAGDADQSVMVLLAKLVGFLVMMAAGLTLMVAIGYVLGGYVGAFITVAIFATILIVVFRSD
jgi:hypothetical protein